MRTINIQPIEKRTDNPDGRLEVHSIFYTIQGEGPFCGSPAIFIRLAGCNLQCPRCDTDYTSSRLEMSAAQILDTVTELRDRHLANSRKILVVITGGEPFRQYLARLAQLLCDNGYFVQIETNGTLPPTIPLSLLRKNPFERYGVYLVCSPKTGKVNPVIQQHACCYKYVLGYDFDLNDGLPTRALEHSASPVLAKPPEGMLVYLQPMDTKDERENQRILKDCVALCMHYNYILQLQVHKLINVE